MTRMALIIPYRNRQAHLDSLLPHLVSYFVRDKLDRFITPVMVLAEQADTLEFNRGAVRNAGFLAIEKDVDYLCFHDVDYLPIWADYTVPDNPTGIVWWGAHERPIRVNQRDLVVKGQTTGLIGVSVMDKAQFRSVNGYSNAYWGWGFEDADLIERFRCKGIPIDNRQGTFIPLDHDNEGFADDGSKSSVWLRNEALFKDKAAGYAAGAYARDGLSSFAGKTLSREVRTIRGLDGVESAELIHLKIDLSGTR